MAEKRKLKVEYVDLSEIVPYSGTPRVNDQAMRSVENSIREFGFKVPIVLDKNKVIVAGHTRYKAAKHMGLTEVPCVIADDLTEEQVKAFRIADNSTSDVALWDDDLLKLELDGLEFDMSDFGLEFIPEDDEDLETAEKKDPQEKHIDKMDLRAFEHYDYLVFVFDNQFDFMNMANEFGIKKVDGGYVNRKVGIGRIVKGAKLVEKLRGKSGDLESGTLDLDLNL